MNLLLVWTVALIPAAPRAAPVLPYVLPDTLGPARAAWRQGEPLKAAELGQKNGSAAGLLLAGLALAQSGEDAQAVPLLQKVTAKGPLGRSARMALAESLRRLGRWKDARAVAESLVKDREPGAAYVLADVVDAAQGCAALPWWRDALRAEPSLPGRHAARLAVVRCDASATARATACLEMLEDGEPVDADTALSALAQLFAQERPPFGMALDPALRLAERLLAEGQAVNAGALLTALVLPPKGEVRARWALDRARALRATGHAEDSEQAIRDALAAGAGTLEPALRKSLVDRLAATAPSAEAAAKYLEVADQYPSDAVGLECRHLAAFHLAEAGKLEEAIPQWDRVAAERNPRDQDAAWFAARSSAKLGKLKPAAERALALGKKWGNTEMGLQARYWAGRWLQQTGDDAGGKTVLAALCQDAPWRLFGRFACERLGKALPAVSAPPKDLEEDPFPVLVALAQDKTLPAAARTEVQAAAALAQVGALGAARWVFKKVLAGARSAPEPLALEIGETGLVLGDTQAVVLLAIRRRGEFDLGRDARWARLAYPRPPQVVLTARAGGVDENLVLAIARTESLFAPGVRSSAGALGLMQLLPSTAVRLVNQDEQRPGSHDLLDPDVNTRLAVRYLKRLGEDFGGRVELVAAGYNAGPKNARRFMERGSGLKRDEFLENIHFRETRGYAKKVLGSYLMYRMLAGQDALAQPDLTMDVVAGQALDF